MMKPMFEEFFIFFIIYLKQNNRKLIFDLTFKLELIVFNIIRYCKNHLKISSLSKQSIIRIIVIGFY